MIIGGMEEGITRTDRYEPDDMVYHTPNGASVLVKSDNTAFVTWSNNRLNYRPINSKP